VRVRARDVMIATEKPAGVSALNVLEGMIAGIDSVGESEALVTILSGSDRLSARVTGRSVQQLGLEPGKPVFAIVKSVSLDSAATARR